MAAYNYLAHTEAGQTIRALARGQSCHPSTVLRQIRSFQGRRDDPLVDDALRALAGCFQRNQNQNKQEDQEAMTPELHTQTTAFPEALTQDRFEEEAKRILRRLCETGAVLAVAMEMDTAVVMRTLQDGETLRTAVVDREIAQAIALKSWITCPNPATRIHKYFITNAGRAALRQMTAADENKAHGFAEKRAQFDGDLHSWTHTGKPQDPEKTRYYVTESPLLGLARRKDRDGKPFLSKELVVAGERLREDFELAQMGAQKPQTWDAFMQTPKDIADASPAAARRAHSRVKSAMIDLGPGLGDVVLRCCCLLEGLEVTEQKLGWSARSGKIVLRIALQRLSRHYEETQGKFGPMIG
jgi:hypothetical protein